MRVCLHVYSMCVPECVCMFCLTASVLWTQSEFSACELASIATSATQPASQAGRQAGSEVNERLSLLVRSESARHRPDAKSGYSGHVGMLMGTNNGALLW